MNTTYSRSEQLRLRRVIAAQGFDARDFRGGRTLRLLLRKQGKASSSYKQLFILNTTGLSTEEAYADAGLPDSYVLSHDSFDPPQVTGPALLSSRRMPVPPGKAEKLLGAMVSKKLLLEPSSKSDAPVRHGPFSNAIQEIAADIRAATGETLYGGRVMWITADSIIEQCYSVMATSRDEAATILAVHVSGRHPESAQTASYEVEKTYFSRPFYGNTLLILEQRSRLDVSEYCLEQGLPAPFVPVLCES